MSKSYGNDIGLYDSPEEMYGKTLSISDKMIVKWLILAADADSDTIEHAKKQLEDPKVNPMEIKRLLARKIVSLFHNDELALKAERHFNEVVVGKGIPDDIPVYSISKEDLIVNVIFDSGLLKSKGEARRMIKQGAVKLDEERVDDIQATVLPDRKQILKVGKRRFLKVHG